MPDSDNRLVYSLYALCCLVWGSTWLVIKIGLAGVPPFLGAGLRFLLASAVLAAIVTARKTPWRLGAGERIAVLSTGATFSVSYGCVYWAEQHISSGLTAILFSTMPLMVALLSCFWTKSETLGVRKLIGILVAMAGTAVLFWPQERITTAQLAGMAAALFSSFLSAWNLVAVKKHGRDADIFVLNALGMGLGALGLLTASLLLESYGALDWTRDNVLAIVYLSLLGSVAAFLAYYHLVKVMEATKLSLITLIFPMVAVGVGWAVLGESVGPGMGAGMAIVLLGVAVAVLPARS